MEVGASVLLNPEPGVVLVDIYKTTFEIEHELP